MTRISPACATPALEKGLDILELLGARPDATTLSGIAAALERSRNEIFRVVRVLEARGYHSRDEHDRFSVTDRMFLIAARRPPFATLVDVATPEMRVLAAAIGQSCHITIPAGERTVLIARVERIPIRSRSHCRSGTICRFTRRLREEPSWR